MLESIDETFDDGRKYNLCISVLDEHSKYIPDNKIKNIVVDWSPSRDCKEYYTYISKARHEKGIFFALIDRYNVVPRKILNILNERVVQ